METRAGKLAFFSGEEKGALGQKGTRPETKLDILARRQSWGYPAGWLWRAIPEKAISRNGGKGKGKNLESSGLRGKKISPLSFTTDAKPLNKGGSKKEC